MPFGWGYAVLVLLQALTVALVRPTARSARLPRHPVLGLLPLAAIGGLVAVLGAVPAAVGLATDLAALAVPILALVAAVHVRRAAVPLALAAPVLWLVAWRAPVSAWTQLAGDLLIVLAAVALGRMTGWIAPRPALAVGIVLAAVVDVWQVLTVQVAPVTAALAAAVPPRGLPALQQLELHGAGMGWGDAYLAALVGVVVAASGRATVAAAAVTAIAGLALGLLFGVLDLLPATVPPALGLLAAGAVERRRVRAWLDAAVESRRARRMLPDKEDRAHGDRDRSR